MSLHCILGVPVGCLGSDLAAQTSEVVYLEQGLKFFVE